VFEAKLQEKLQKGSSFVRDVRRSLLRIIGQEKIITISILAAQFGMSERNFQMKLEKEEVSFRELLEEVQADFALRFLKAGSPVAEIAYALGFSESSAFQRAFKRWTGLTPGQARADK
jgi:AraC-like DNA-binding protein